METAVPKREQGSDRKVAVVTGGASGIGQALAVAYGRSGTRTVVGYYPADPHDVGRTIDLVKKVGGEATAVEVDVRDSAQVDRLAEQAMATYGRLDIAVANAGILRRASLSDMTDQAWDELLDVDLTGVLRTFRSASARMTGGGSLVAISSITGGVYGWEDHAHYAAAKAGVLGVCRSLAVELAPRAIRVNAVIPGLIETPQSLDAANSLGPEGLRSAARLIPWGRVGRAEEVASVIEFLTGEGAAYVTGQQLVVDGGLTVRWPE